MLMEGNFFLNIQIYFNYYTVKYKFFITKGYQYFILYAVRYLQKKKLARWY